MNLLQAIDIAKELLLVGQPRGTTVEIVLWDASRDGVGVRISSIDWKHNERAGSWVTQVDMSCAPTIFATERLLLELMYPDSEEEVVEAKCRLLGVINVTPYAVSDLEPGERYVVIDPGEADPQFKGTTVIGTARHLSHRAVSVDGEEGWVGSLWNPGDDGLAIFVSEKDVYR